MRQTFPLDNDHSSAFAEDHSISFGIEGTRAFVSGPFPSGKSVKCAQRGEFYKMHVCELLLTSSDDGGIDDSVSYHLDGAVECDQ